MFRRFTLNLQRFADGDPQPIKIGDVEYTIEDLQKALNEKTELEKSYKKLEADHTKKSQGLSELEKQFESLKPWGDFQAYLQQNPTLAKDLDELVSKYQSGAQTTAGDVSKLTSAINKAEKQGDDETVKRLEALEQAMLEKQMDETFASLVKRAEKDNLEDFTLDGFKEFATKWLEDELGIGDDDDVTPREIKQAYTAYKADLLEQTIKSGKIPRVGTGGGAADIKPPKDAPKGLKNRSKQALDYLSRLR